jgi:23S rRNA pseudouridine1911/1915/1917 synthase
MESASRSITYSASPQRIDRLLSTEFPEYSRTYFKQLIDDRLVLVNGTIIKKPSLYVNPGDIIEVTFPPARIIGALSLPEKDLGIRLLYEHPDFLILYKPVGILAHSPTHYSDTITLVDWLVHTFRELHSVGFADRPGIVHRLDKDTSGLLIVPRNNSSHAYFSELFKQRKIQKTYLAVVKGLPTRTGTIDFAITRHPLHKHKMTSVGTQVTSSKRDRSQNTPTTGRDALTHYQVLEYFADTALIEVHPITGRTHQIRVHCSAIGHPIIGDATYGQPSTLIDRQALHAHQLSFLYKEKYYSFWYDLPTDIKGLIYQLKRTI